MKMPECFVIVVRCLAPANSLYRRLFWEKKNMVCIIRRGKCQY